ncbi:MAG: hypothetical protein WA939_23830, partial [Nodosilinea sp.]
MAEKQYTLEAVQGRLKQQKSKAMIFLRGGDNIWVRGTFPPRPDSGKTRACQDKFSLHLPANRDGFKAAEKEALRISALLINLVHLENWSFQGSGTKLKEARFTVHAFYAYSQDSSVAANPR